MKVIEFLLNSRNRGLSLDRNLASKKDCRRGNSGNYKELQVLTRIHHVP
ncbi:uncharacterized protein LOC130896589 [Diorhabda carinulata]|nr:uncharacterized protein LOC130896589 [Diorhabda carinulata]